MLPSEIGRKVDQNASQIKAVHPSSQIGVYMPIYNAIDSSMRGNPYYASLRGMSGQEVTDSRTTANDMDLQDGGIAVMTKTPNSKKPTIHIAPKLTGTLQAGPCGQVITNSAGRQVPKFDNNNSKGGQMVYDLICSGDNIQAPTVMGVTDYTSPKSSQPTSNKTAAVNSPPKGTTSPATTPANPTVSPTDPNKKEGVSSQGTAKTTGTTQLNPAQKAQVAAAVSSITNVLKSLFGG